MDRIEIRQRSGLPAQLCWRLWQHRRHRTKS